MIEIEMVPIYHMTAQTFRYIYLIIIKYYPNIIKSLLRGIRSPILRVYAKFVIPISYLFLLFYLYYKDI